VKPREWWIDFTVPSDPESACIRLVTPWPTENVSLRKTAVHVREVLPDTVTISREELKKAMNDAHERVLENWQKDKLDPRKNILTYIEEFLFDQALASRARDQKS